MSVNGFFREFVRSHVLTELVILIVLFLLIIWVTSQSPGKPELYLVQAGIATTIVALMALIIAQQLHRLLSRRTACCHWLCASFR
jgi:hypothetical protein